MANEIGFIIRNMITHYYMWYVTVFEFKLEKETKEGKSPVVKML